MKAALFALLLAFGSIISMSQPSLAESTPAIDRRPAMEEHGPSVVKESIQEEAKGPITTELAYTGEFVRNFKGGASIGSSYLGLATWRTGFDFERLMGWKGGSFFLHLQATHGDHPTEHVGDAQVTTNLEATANTGKVYEAYFQQAWADGNASLLVGLYDLNSEFYATESSALFLNASFGIGREMSQTGVNGPSIYPTTSLASRLRVQGSKENYLQVAVFDAVSGDPDSPHGTHLRFDPNDGQLLVGEFGLLPGAGSEGLSGKYAIGAWFYTEPTDDQLRVDANGDRVKTLNSGIYFLVDQKLSSKFAVFARYGSASTDANRFASNLGVGMNWTSPLGNREHDVFGLALTSVENGRPYRQATEAAGTPTEADETTYELTYRVSFSEELSLQPSFQYVVHPDADPSRENAFVGLIRFRVGIEK
jgi:porin